MTNDRAVVAAAPCSLTSGTARKSALTLVGSIVVRTYPRRSEWNLMCGLVAPFGIVVLADPSPVELIDVHTSSEPMVADRGSA